MPSIASRWRLVWRKDGRFLLGMAHPSGVAPESARRCGWAPARHVGVMQRKGDLPTKICVVCGRPFTWRRKWARVWDEVRYCSEACRRRKAAGAVPELPPQSRKGG